MFRHVLYWVFLCMMIFPFFEGKGQIRDSARKLTTQEKSNFEIIIQFHAERGYIKKFIESGKMSQDIEWFVPGPKEILPFAGLWKGVSEITEFNRLLSATIRYDSLAIKQYIVDGDQVIAIFWAEGIAKATGKPFKSEVLRFYTFKDGKIIKVRNFFDTASYVSAVSK